MAIYGKNKFLPDLAEASSTNLQTLNGGFSELTICLIVLPVVIVFLIAVLLCVALPRGRSKIPNSTHCCFGSGRTAHNGDAAALTVSTAASSPSSTMNQVTRTDRSSVCNQTRL